LKLGYEERSVGLNRAKITDQWRSILRKAKTVDLRRDVVTLKVGKIVPIFFVAQMCLGSWKILRKTTLFAPAKNPRKMYTRLNSI
jgi:hypothetical protein